MRFQLRAALRAPHAMFYFVTMLIECWLALGIRCCGQFGAARQAVTPGRQHVFSVAENSSFWPEVAAAVKLIKVRSGPNPCMTRPSTTHPSMTRPCTTHP